MKKKLIIGLLLIAQVSGIQASLRETEAQKDVKTKWFAYVASRLSTNQQAECEKVTANRYSNPTAFNDFWNNVMVPEMYKIWAADRLEEQPHHIDEDEKNTNLRR